MFSGTVPTERVAESFKNLLDIRKNVKTSATDCVILSGTSFESYNLMKHQFASLVSGLTHVSATLGRFFRRGDRSAQPQPLEALEARQLFSVTAVHSLAVGNSGSISGVVFNDNAGNGQQNPQGFALAGQHVWIDANDDGKWEPGEPAVTTDGNGFTFTGLADGSYTLRYYVPPGFHQTVPTDYGPQVATVTGQQPIRGVNFGVASGSAGIFGSVFNDANASGVQDAGEANISGQHLWIDLHNDGQYDPGDPTAITDSNGNFAFAGLADGTYTVRYYAPPGFHQTTPASGSGRIVTLAGEPIDNQVFGVAPGSALSTPFTGVPSSIPGLINADNFDNGGEGIAYHWHTATNPGTGSYRPDTGVGINVSTDNSSGDNGSTIGYAYQGDWLKYTVNVTASGVYTLALRMAQKASGGQLHVEIDGQNVTGVVNVPNTGGWAVWQTISIGGINLTAGQHVVKVSFDVNANDDPGLPTNYVANLNWLLFTAGG